MKKVKLQEICNITTGKLDANQAKPKGKYPFFTCASEPSYIDTFAFDEKVILIAGNNASGNFHLNRFFGKFNAYQRTYVLTVKENYNFDYIYYALKIALRKTKEKSQGSQTKFLTMPILTSFLITLPDLPTQTAIAKVLSSLDDKIELNNKINKELEATVKELYDYWFVQNADKGWERVRLSEIANITMGQSPDGSSYNENGDGIIFYQGCTDFGERFPIVRQYTTAPTRFAQVGDILLSVRAPVGSINFANTKCCIGRGLAALNSKIGSIAHLYFVLNELKVIFNRMNFAGTTFGAITKDDLYSLSVIKPPQKILLNFEKIAKPIFEKQFIIAEESICLAQLRDFQLPLLMNGQVKITKEKSTPTIIPFKESIKEDTKYKAWKEQVGAAARGDIDEKTLRNIYEATDEDDR